MMPAHAENPHAGQPLLHHGADLSDARLGVVLVHGRGDSAAGILGLAQHFEFPDVAWLAPQAAGHAWYPYSFLAPMEQNQPGLDSGLRVLDAVVAHFAGAGLAADRVVLMGFSQGACLAQEYAARHARRYAAIVGLSGGLIGPPGTPRAYPGSFDGTPLFLGCSDVDPHIPESRVHESAEVFERMGARVDKRIYPGMGHTVNRDELDAIAQLLAPRQ